jgi:S-adenosylmethionine:tRNA ribosyltransferase-isomerase
MLVRDFDYELPSELIAQEPLPERSASRMLHLSRESRTFIDRHFSELPRLLRPGDLLVINNTKVFPARLLGRRFGARARRLSPRNPATKEFLHGEVEALLTRQLDENTWQALVHPGRKIGTGERLFFGETNELEAEVIARGQFGERTLKFLPVPNFFERVEKIGHVPLPPYISRTDQAGDRNRYQTVYARDRGSVAAPTAGLHFTPQIMEEIRQHGVEIAEITLHVGLGTFQPVRVAKVEEHRMHSERYSISMNAAQRIDAALRTGRHIVAVGTTTVRALEHAALKAGGNSIQSGAAEADLFIYPGFKFQIVGALLTNFHLPQSTLLMLVSAFAGREFVIEAYGHAVRKRYRFFSYGDCMFIE